MSKTLTYEQMMALFAKGEKETAELRKSMAEGFAESRKETAELSASIARLEAAMEKTNARVDATNARLDKAIAKLDENTAKLEKNNAKLDENTAKLEKNNAKLDENNAKLDENTAKLVENSQKTGDLNNKVGRIIESIVLPGIVDKFNEKGFKFDKVLARVDILNEEKNARLAELDALLENGKFVIALESKTDLEIKDVNKHIKRLEALRKLSRFAGKKIYGALTTAIVREESVDYALKHGFYVLQQPDVIGVKILDFPKGHSAKAW